IPKLVRCQVDGAVRTPANFISDGVLVDMVVPAAIRVIVCIFGSRIECFLAHVSPDPDLDGADTVAGVPHLDLTMRGGSSPVVPHGALEVLHVGWRRAIEAWSASWRRKKIWAPNAP